MKELRMKELRIMNVLHLNRSTLPQAGVPQTVGIYRDLIYVLALLVAIFG